MRQDAYIVCDLYAFGTTKKKCVFEEWKFRNIFTDSAYNYSVTISEFVVGSLLLDIIINIRLASAVLFSVLSGENYIILR
jgi:hypothetical protein